MPRSQEKSQSMLMDEVHTEQKHSRREGEVVHYVWFCSVWRTGAHSASRADHWWGADNSWCLLPAQGIISPAGIELTHLEQPQELQL